ncbi:MAG TPA: hypothetical protein PJ982_11110 [Lacipirellulaceae bacterium]|nr:hypothetical protein [Lacipirellulaceae bacterium]
MEFNRNQYFFLGIVLFLMGLQFRLVHSYTLTAEATKFLAERSNQSATDSAIMSISTDFGAVPQKVIPLPDWSGWCLMSVGGVLVLHSLAMKKPGA